MGKNSFIVLILFLVFTYCAPVFAASTDFWNKAYTFTNLEVLQLKIENWETSRKADNVNYQATTKQDGYIYNIHLIDYDSEYKIRFMVWATDKKTTKERVADDMKTIAKLFLKDDWSDKIKISVLYNPVNVMDADELIYDGYVK